MILRLSYDILSPKVTTNYDKLKINLKIFCKSGPRWLQKFNGDFLV